MTVTKNAYFGVECSCSGLNLFQAKGDGCEHTAMVSDSKLLGFLINSLRTDEKGRVGDKYRYMNEDQLRSYQ